MAKTIHCHMDTESDGQRRADISTKRPTDRQAGQTDPQLTSKKTRRQPASKIKRQACRQMQTNELVDRQTKRQGSRFSYKQ